jgi:subtilisin family serine protease
MRTSISQETRAVPVATIVAILVAMSGFLAPVDAGAAGGDRIPPRLARLEGDRDLAKLSWQLLEARRLARLGSAPAAIRERIPGLPLRDGKVAVEIRFRGKGELPLDELERAGLGGARAYPEYGGVTGRVALRSLDTLAAVAGVGSIRELLPPRRRAGTVTSQGDESIRAALARSTFGVDGEREDGTRVKVGILSDSFGNFLGDGVVTGSGCATEVSGSSPQLAGELPNPVVVLDDCTNLENCEFVLDEGRALAEIVHDLAPGADVLFHSGFNGEFDMATGITELVACGADVIVDDVIYPREPMFQDGPIADAVQSAVGAGVAFFSAAGNEAGFGVSEAFLDVDDTVDDEEADPTGSDFHDFGGSDPFASVRMADGCGATFVLQWNEPYDTPSGQGASSDLDLYVCSDESIASCDYVSTGQGCSLPSFLPPGDPLEVYSEPAPSGSAKTVHLAIDHFCSLTGAYPQQDDTRFRLVVFADGCSLAEAEVKADCSTSTKSYCFEEGIFEDFQIFGHAAAEGAVAVGASYYREIDSGGAIDPPPGQIDVEPFSSLGGSLPFYFDADGNPLPGAPVTRFKPDVVGPDGVNTSFFPVGGDLPDDLDGYPNFVGTSAAAPHAAAVGALLKDAQPLLSGADVAALLRCTARDIEAPGVDPLAGSGLVDAVEALTALEPQLGLVKSVAFALTGNLSDTNRLDAGDVLQYSYEVTNSSAVPLEEVAVADPHAGLSTISCPGGNPIPSLEPGASTVCTANYTVKVADESAGSISNSATVTGKACGVTAAAGQAGDVLTIPTCILDRVLLATVVANGQEEQELACRTLDSGSSYTIESGGSATFTAGVSIVLQDGFSVAGSFTAALDSEIDLQ